MSTSIQSLQSLIQYYADHRVEKIYIKVLAANDNSKNQVYFGPGFKALTLFPTGDVYPDPSGDNPIFKAGVDFLWIGDDTSLVNAPSAQIILYPQYPEIRFSGFLKGCDRSRLDSTRTLMNSRIPGRILFLGTDNQGRIIGSVFKPDSSVCRQAMEISAGLVKATEIFSEIVTSFFLGVGSDPRTTLLTELCRIHRLGWINSKRLDATKTILPCKATQCGGYTLEAELGITPNGRSEPDFQGWEVKQHGGNVLTLMTPEPTGGFYVERGVEEFVRTFGYMDRLGRADRMNFGGTHFCNQKHPNTGLTITLQGYDSLSGKITDADGGIAMSSGDGTLAAFWAFTGILKHWNRKHRNAVYVPSKHRTDPENQYTYGNIVRLGEGTDPLYLLKAIESQMVYYDPGIKLEGINDVRPSTKRRSQFRVKLRDLNSLYVNVNLVDVTAYCE